MVHTRCDRATEVQAIVSNGQSRPEGLSGEEAPGNVGVERGQPCSGGAGSGDINFFAPRRIVPLTVILGGFIAFFLFDLDAYVSFDSLKQNRQWLLNQVSEHAVVTMMTFILIYATVVAFSLPGATVMTLTGGFLFGQFAGTACNVIGATIGATLLFLAARTVFGDILERKAGPWLKMVEEGFRRNAFNYLLFLRLVPAFPFFVVNLVPAFLNVRLRTFVTATFIGIIPGGFVYTTVGAGLGSVFDMDQEFSLSGVLTPQIVAAMVGLALLALLPVAVRWWQSR